MNNSQGSLLQIKSVTPNLQPLTLEDLLQRLNERFDAVEDRLEAIEGRIADITLDYGTGYTIED